MATDATGTPTSPDNLPTYNTAVDSPSGKGFNAAMAAIQTALSNRPSTPASIATGEAMIWNGTTFVRSSVQGLSPSGISGYPTDALKVLKGDGTWTKRGMALLWDSVDAGVPLGVASTINTPPLDQGFRHLRVEIVCKSTAAATAVNLTMQVDGISTASYDYAFNTVSNGTNSPSSGVGQTSALVGVGAGATTASALGVTTIDLVNYTLADGTHTNAWTFQSFNAGSYTAATMQSVIGGGSFGSVGALSTLTFLVSAGFWAAPSRVSVYGIGL